MMQWFLMFLLAKNIYINQILICTTVLSLEYSAQLSLIILLIKISTVNYIYIDSILNNQFYYKLYVQESNL